MSAEISLLLNKRQERTVAALERIKERVDGHFLHELRVTSTSYEDIFGGFRCCRLCKVIPVTELNWFCRFIGSFFPGDWLEPIVNVRIRYSGDKVIYDERIGAIVAPEMQQLASEIVADEIAQKQ